jgi:hypothetical protein
MPIRVRVFEDQRLVLAIAYDKVTEDDMFSYQHEIWSRREYAEFSEIMDLTRVEEFTLPSADRVKELADLAASRDTPFSSGRLAIVASDQTLFSLGQVYSEYRESHPLSNKKVEVFATIEEALHFMGLEALP